MGGSRLDSGVAWFVGALLAVMPAACGKDKKDAPAPPPVASDAGPVRPSGGERLLRALGVGSRAPDFTSPAHDGTTVKMSDLRGQVVVLYFYPKDETPG